MSRTEDLGDLWLGEPTLNKEKAFGKRKRERFGWLVHQVDVKAAFLNLNGILGEEVYMKLRCDDQREARLWKRLATVEVDDNIIIGWDLREIEELKNKREGEGLGRNEQFCWFARKERHE